MAIDGMGRPGHAAIGPLRAWNDDEFAPHAGFAILGNRSTVQAGDVQAMRAGTLTVPASGDPLDTDALPMTPTPACPAPRSAPAPRSHTAWRRDAKPIAFPWPGP